MKIDQQTMITALLTGSAAPLLNKYFFILLAAVFGALVTISRTHQESLWEAVKQMFRSIVFAVVLTGVGALAISLCLSKFLGINISAEEFVFPLAFFIALAGDDLFKIKDRLIALVTRGKDA